MIMSVAEDVSFRNATKLVKILRNTTVVKIKGSL